MLRTMDKDIGIFKLNAKEHEYIISSLQKEITKLSQIKSFATREDALANHKKVMELMQAVEVLKSKKIWTDTDFS